MIDFDILRECDTTNERLRQFFTAKMPSPQKQAKMSRQELRAVQKDVKLRQDFEAMVSGWLNEHVVYNLKHHQLYSAVDLAWDSVPINKQLYPLLQYAQGRIDVTKAAKDLEQTPNGKTYVRKNSAGEVLSIDLPKFTEMNVNLIRSVITRRVAAQEAKYNALWPWYWYQARSNTQVGRLRGDLASQRMDIMADQYGYRHFQTQVTRDMFLYGNSTAFPRASWERDVQWAKASNDPDLAYDVDAQGNKKVRKKAVTVREGISWVNPHPSRVFYDNNYPLSSLNTDSGCEFVGFWDVMRWGDIASNPDYFNRDCVQISATATGWYENYWMYFNQYYDSITPPDAPIDPADNNDRKLNVGAYTGGVYTGQMTNIACFFTHIWVKVDPVRWGWGKYPYPIWVHLKIAGLSTIVYADIMPSSPAAVFQLNANDGRLMNISVAHELMQYQDQLSNLYSQLLETIKTDLFRVAVLNTDVFPDTPEGKKVKDEFIACMKGNTYYAEPQLLCTSLEKLAGVLGRAVTPDMVFTVVRSTPNTQIQHILAAITQVINMADRLMVMSSHEQAQAAPHELTATETTQISGSTETIYSFISNAIDEGRAAMKRICFESTIACGEDEVELPVSNRYPESVIEKAGFTTREADEDSPVGFKIVYGPKTNLVHDFIFTSRDGGNRQANSQAAQVLVQLLQAIGSFHPAVQNAILSRMGASKVFEILNTVFRLADAGVDMKLELRPGEQDTLLLEDDQQVMQIIQRMGQALQQDTAEMQQIKQVIAQMQQRGQAREQILISYKDAPPDVQRQMEMKAGFQPSHQPPQSTQQ